MQSAFDQVSRNPTLLRGRGTRSPCKISSGPLRHFSPVRRQTYRSPTPGSANATNLPRPQLVLQTLASSPVVHPVPYLVVRTVSQPRAAAHSCSSVAPMRLRSCSPAPPIGLRPASPLQGLPVQSSRGNSLEPGAYRSVSTFRPVSVSAESASISYLPSKGGVPVALPVRRSRIATSHQRALCTSRSPQRLISKGTSQFADALAQVHCTGAPPQLSPSRSQEQYDPSVSRSPTVVYRSHLSHESCQLTELAQPSARHNSLLSAAVHDKFVRLLAHSAEEAMLGTEVQSMSTSLPNEATTHLALTEGTSTHARSARSLESLRKSDAASETEAAEQNAHRDQRNRLFQSCGSDSTAASPYAAGRRDRPISYIMAADGQVLRLDGRFGHDGLLGDEPMHRGDIS